MRKALKIALGASVAALLLIQAIRPERTNPPENPPDVITARLAVPGPVRAILERSCYDCHSNRTRWPWYSEIAPASWLLARDVREGREHLNFSEWGTYKRAKMMARLESICAEVDKGDMPLPAYLLAHGDAKLSESDKTALCAWTEQAGDSLGE